MSATLAPTTPEVSRLALDSSVGNGAANGSPSQVLELSVSKDIPSLKDHVMRSGSVNLARISYLMEIGEQLGLVDTNFRGVKTLVVDTETHGAIRVLDFTGVADGTTHPYRVQRLRYSPEDFYVNTRASQDSPRSRYKRASYVQGGLSEPEFGINQLLNAACNHLLMMTDAASIDSKP